MPYFVISILKSCKNRVPMEYLITNYIGTLPIKVMKSVCVNQFRHGELKNFFGFTEETKVGETNGLLNC